MVLEPAVAPYGTACPSLLYSFARRPDNLARYPIDTAIQGSSKKLPRLGANFTCSRAASCERTAAHETCGVSER